MCIRKFYAQQQQSPAFMLKYTAVKRYMSVSWNGQARRDVTWAHRVRGAYSSAKTPSQKKGESRCLLQHHNSSKPSLRFLYHVPAKQRVISIDSSYIPSPSVCLRRGVAKSCRVQAHGRSSYTIISHHQSKHQLHPVFGTSHFSWTRHNTIRPRRSAQVSSEYLRDAYRTAGCRDGTNPQPPLCART